ncbi:NAD(P)/FAD-dependent oxidoreductase [uncultured Streptomyces sp.]|uniref:NAD(P)/FAD-dependent oxidoreductase n=1 Tax=uncultured Streptomyces sp. TaxID=174707 RepID=UPI00260C886C|nr:FAD-dependent oxidoreductase [uncultured Streptomyces sp.]
MSENTEVVVIGGGYAGVMAANRLTQRDDVTVTLVNPRPAFVERIRLHQVVGGSHDGVVAYRKVLAAGVRLVVDTAARIDTAGRTVALAGGGTLPYDYLVYAVGSGSADPQVPGAAEFARPIASLEEAERLRADLAAVPTTAPVTVVGAGPTGIETAAELAETGRPVTLVCGRMLGPYLHPRARRAVAGRLAKLGVKLLTGPGAQVTEVTADTVRLGDGREVPGAVTVWTAGFGVPDLAARSGLRTDALGRLLTDETLTSVDDGRVVAAGDSAAPSNLPFRMSCQAALPLGAQAADTVLRRIADERPSPVSLGFVGQCISLGRAAGLVQIARKSDTPTALHLAGVPAAKVKELVCGFTVKQLVREAAKPGSLFWLKDTGRERALEGRRPVDTSAATGPTEAVRPEPAVRAVREQPAGSAADGA